MVTEPRTAPGRLVCQMMAPVWALSAYTEPVLAPVAVPSTTASVLLPCTSASAGLPPVEPSSVSLHTWLHFVS